MARVSNQLAYVLRKCSRISVHLTRQVYKHETLSYKHTLTFRHGIPHSGVQTQ